MRTLKDSMLLLLGAAGGVVVAGLARSSDLWTVRRAFRAWSSGHGSLFDLMADDAEVVIPGTARHCGTFSKQDFMRAIATPFMGRFSKPPAPCARRLWSHRGSVVVLADAHGTRRDGKPYANSYVFVLTMRRGQIVRATEFLDMAAFNEVWDQVEPDPVSTRQTEQAR